MENNESPRVEKGGAIFAWIFAITEALTVILLVWLPMGYWQSFLFVFVGSLLAGIVILSKYGQMHTKGVCSVSISLLVYSLVIAYVNTRLAAG